MTIFMYKFFYTPPCISSKKVVRGFPGSHLLVQNWQWKLHKNLWNLFKVNNEDTWTTSVVLFSLLIEQVTDGWVKHLHKIFLTFSWRRSLSCISCIYRNQWTDFYMIATSIMKEVGDCVIAKKLTAFSTCNINYRILGISFRSSFFVEKCGNICITKWLFQWEINQNGSYFQIFSKTCKYFQKL